MTLLAAGMSLRAASPESLPGPNADALVEKPGAARGADGDDREELHEPVERGEARRASLKGIVESLGDELLALPHADEAEQFQEARERRVRGRGHERRGGSARPEGAEGVRGSPAAQAGIEKGDLIVAVNGRLRIASASTARNAPRARDQGPLRHGHGELSCSPGR